MNMEIGKFTNGAYCVFGVLTKNMLYGLCYKTKYPSVIKKWSWVEITKYHLPTDTNPHFDIIFDNEYNAGLEALQSDTKQMVDFYMWMQENEHDHNIRARVENRAEAFFNQTNK